MSPSRHSILWQFSPVEAKPSQQEAQRAVFVVDRAREERKSVVVKAEGG